MNQKDINRALALIKRLIKQLDLNLKGYKVLTELASNAYFFTPLIALMAGADQVYIWCKDNAYGKADELKQDFDDLIRAHNLPANYEISSNCRNNEHIASADIITNLGNIKPLNTDFIAKTKSNISVPLMYDAWEYREGEIDLDLCKRKNIKVAGSWESHPDIKVFESIGALALKMAFEAGYEIYCNNIMVWSDDDFGRVILDYYKQFNPNEITLTNDTDIFYKKLDKLDFIFLTDYSETRHFFGEKGIFDIDRIIGRNPDLGIVHLYGEVDFHMLNENGINVFPAYNGRAKYMSITLAHLGLSPTLALNTAGLKVGELLSRNIESDLCQRLV